MNMQSHGSVRLLALNLALVFVFGLFLSPAALAGEAEPEAPQRTESAAASYPYLIRVGSTKFRSDEDFSGYGWRYDSSSGVLMLSDGYSAGPITASGDLSLYTKGNIRIYGRDGLYYGGPAIHVDGRLHLTNLSGNLFLQGGDSTERWVYGEDFQPEGGEAILARDGLFYMAAYGSLTAIGGANTRSLGGSGIYVPRGTARFMALPRTQSYADGWTSFAGPFSSNATVSIIGGEGRVGGNAILSLSTMLNIDGRVTGGAGRYSRYAGHGLCCYAYDIGYYFGDQTDSLSKESGLNVVVESGGFDVPAVINPDGRVPREGIDSRHLGKKTSWVTPHTLTFYPLSYSVQLNGSGGSPTGQATQKTLTYPAGLDLHTPAFRKADSYLHGYYDSQQARTVMRYERNHIPTGNTTLTARWAPYRTDSVLFLGNYGLVDGGEYQEQQTHRLYTVPTASNAVKDYSKLLGWCGTGAPDWNEKTGALGESAVWLEGGSAVTTEQQSVYWAQWDHPSYGMIRYHGNGGVKADGSNLAVKTTRATDSDLRLYVGDAQGFDREGYTFEGWAEQPGGGTVRSAGEFASGEQQLDLYAQWKEIVIEDISDQISLTGALILPAQDMPVTLRSLMGQVRINGQPVPSGGTVTYLVDGTEVRPDAVLTDVRPYSLTVRYRDRFHAGEKTFRIEQIRLDFNIAPSQYKTFLAVYDRSDRMLSVSDTGGAGTVTVPWQIYDRMDHAKLFFVDPTESTPKLNNLTLPRP